MEFFSRIGKFSSKNSKKDLKPRIKYNYEPVKFVKEISPAGKADLALNKE